MANEFLSPEKKAVITALISRLLPDCLEDEQENSRVVTYVMSTFGHRYPRLLPHLYNVLDDLRSLAMLEYEHDFLVCSTTQKENIITKLLTLNLASVSLIFQQLVLLCLEAWLHPGTSKGDGYVSGERFMGFDHAAVNTP